MNATFEIQWKHSQAAVWRLLYAYTAAEEHLAREALRLAKMQYKNSGAVRLVKILEESK